MILLLTLGCKYLFELFFSFSSTIYPGVELLDHMAVLFLALEETRHCFTWWLHQFTSPQEWKGFPFIHIFSNTYLGVRFLNDNHYVTISFCDSARSYLTVVLFCMSIMIREVENLFTDLLAICLSSSEKCLFKSSIFNKVVLFFNTELYELFIYFGY